MFPKSVMIKVVLLGHYWRKKMRIHFMISLHEKPNFLCRNILTFQYMDPPRYQLNSTNKIVVTLSKTSGHIRVGGRGGGGYHLGGY